MEFAYQIQTTTPIPYPHSDEMLPIHTVVADEEGLTYYIPQYEKVFNKKLALNDAHKQGFIMLNDAKISVYYGIYVGDKDAHKNIDNILEHFGLIFDLPDCPLIAKLWYCAFVDYIINYPDKEDEIKIEIKKYYTKLKKKIYTFNEDGVLSIL